MENATKKQNHVELTNALDDAIETRLTKLETSLAYLQDTVNQLNDIVSKEQMLVSRLAKQNEILAKRVEELDTEARPNRKPPHY